MTSTVARRLALLLLGAGGSLVVHAQDRLEYSGDPYGTRQEPAATPVYRRSTATPYPYGSEPVASPEGSPRMMETAPGRLSLPVQSGASAYPVYANPAETPARAPEAYQPPSNPPPYTQGAPVYGQSPPQRVQQPAVQQSYSAPQNPVVPAPRVPAPPPAGGRPYAPHQGYPPATPPGTQPRRPQQYQDANRQSLEATLQRQGVRAPAVQNPGYREAVGHTPALEEIFRLLNGRKPGVQLNIWFPGVGELGNVQVAQGATAAEGIALRLGETPVFVSSNPGVTPGKFNVAIGLVEQLRGLVDERELKANSDGHLLLRQVPNRPDTWLLVIAGRTRQGLDNAILSLGLAREKLPGIATAAIQDIVLPEAPPFLRMEPLRAETLYTFQQMQDIGVVMTMQPNRKLRIEFAFPGDFSPRYNGDLILDLHYSHPAFYGQQGYGAQPGVRGALSRLSAKANDVADETFYGVSQPIIEGGMRGTINIPARLFRQGNNFVEIDFPGAGTEGFQIFSDSTFSLPAWNISPSLPNLTLTARTAYPFIGQPDGSEIFVYLAGSEIETVESTWTLLAKMAQSANTLLYGTEFSIAGDTKLLGLNPEARHMIVVGKSSSVPADYRVGMPEDIFREILHKSEDQIVIPRRNLREIIVNWRRGETVEEPDEVEKVSPAEVDARNSQLKRYERGYLGSFPPVKDRHGWILLLTAETGLNLRQRTYDLIQPAFWKRITGASIFWNNIPESLKVYTETPKARPILAALDENQLVDMPLGETMSVRVWIMATASSLFAFIITLSLAVRRKARVRAVYR